MSKNNNPQYQVCSASLFSLKNAVRDFYAWATCSLLQNWHRQCMAWFFPVLKLQESRQMFRSAFLLLFCLDIAHNTGKCSARLLGPLSKSPSAEICSDTSFCPSKMHHGALSRTGFLSFSNATTPGPYFVWLLFSLLSKNWSPTSYVCAAVLFYLKVNTKHLHVCLDFSAPKT